MCGPLSSILTQSRRLELNITFLHQILLHFISVEGVGHVRGSSRYFQHTPQSGRLHRVEMWKGRAEGMLCFYCDSAPFLSLWFCTFFLSSLRFCTFLMILTIVNLHQIYIIYFQGYKKCAVKARLYKKPNGGYKVTMPEPRPPHTCGEECDMSKRKNVDYIPIRKSLQGMIKLGNYDCIQYI